MTTLFGRTWLVTVGTGTGPGGTDALQTSALDIKFKVEKTLRTRANKCTLEIYNLNDTHRAQLLAVSQPFVQLAAGYGSHPPVLFQGNGRKVFVVREKTEWIARITAGDGEYAIRSARVVQSFGPGTGLPQVVQTIARAMGVGLGNALTALRNAAFASGVGNTFPEGTVLQGRAAEELDGLCASANLEWSVQDGNLQLLPLGGNLGRQAVLLSAGDGASQPNTGLMGSPEAGKGALVKCKARIQAGLDPGATVRIQSAGINGVYRIEKADYEGESKAGADDWTAELQCRAVPT